MELQKEKVQIKDKELDKLDIVLDVRNVELKKT